jgi:hypothetical protein
MLLVFVAGSFRVAGFVAPPVMQEGLVFVAPALLPVIKGFVLADC